MTRKYAWSELPAEKMNPLLSRRVIHTGKITLSQLDLKKGSVVPAHQHPNEQISCVMTGTLRFWVGADAAGGDDRPSIQVNAGEVLTIPGGVPHRVLTEADSITFDFFTPPREDWIKGEDSYLRMPRMGKPPT